MKKLIGILFVGALLICACGPSPENLANQTIVAAFSTAEDITATPATPPTATHPTYSEVIATYPAGTELNTTDAKIAKAGPDGSISFGGGSTMSSCGGTPIPWKCFGAKFTITGDNVTLDGVPYPAGAMLTVDKNLNWIQVSSWN